MKKIRVLHILDELNTGGAERIVVNYFQNVNRELFQWDFVITQYADIKKRGMLEDTVEKLGGHIYRVPRKRKNYIKNITETAKIIKNGNYDIVHSHLDELSALYLFAAKKYKVPVRICHSHLAGAQRGRGVEIVCKISHPIMQKYTTDKFACGIEAGKALWGNNAMENGEVYIMRNAIKTDKFHFDDEIRKKKRLELNVGENTVYGTVGRLSYQKNSAFLIPIFTEIKKNNPHSVLAVVGEGELRAEMESMVKNAKLEDSVYFLGGREDVNELMMAMDVFLLPSRFEGLPIVMVEAQCTGLTCLVSNQVTKEIKINPNVEYMSISESPGFWAKRCLSIYQLDNRESATKGIIEAGYEISNAAKELERYYLSALSRRRP